MTGKSWTGRSWISTQAPHIAARLRDGGFEPIDSVLHLGAEVGEFLGAWTRYKGWARRSGSEEDARMELADVVIAAYVVAHHNGWNLDPALMDGIAFGVQPVDAVLRLPSAVGRFIDLRDAPGGPGQRPLADVVTCALMVAELEDWDLAADVAAKVGIGYTRGFGTKGVTRMREVPDGNG